jgi:hypothetical protein
MKDLVKHTKDYAKEMHAVVARAAQDGTFRQQLLHDPDTTLKEVLRVAPPETLRIKFVEKDPDVDVVIMLPALVTEAGEPPEEDVAS